MLTGCHVETVKPGVYETTDLPFFTLWELSHSEQRQPVEELPELRDKTRSLRVCFRSSDCSMQTQRNVKDRVVIEISKNPNTVSNRLNTVNIKSYMTSTFLSVSIPSKPGVSNMRRGDQKWPWIDSKQAHWTSWENVREGIDFLTAVSLVSFTVFPIDKNTPHLAIHLTPKIIN